MPFVPRHRRPGRGTLFLIFLAVAVFWTGISIGVFFGRRHGPATRPAGTTSAPSAAPAVEPRAPSEAATTLPSAADALRAGDRIELRIEGGSHASSAQVMEVDPVGFVTVPILGSMRAEHLTPAQLEQAIAQKYKERNLMPPGPVRVVRVAGKAATAPAGR